MTIDRNRIPRPGAPRPFNFPDFERIRLANDLEIIYAFRNDLPLVSVNLCLQPSALLDPPGKEGLANLTADLLVEGTQTRSSTQIAEELEMIGAQYGSHTDWKAVYVEVNTLERHLETALEILADMILQPAFPQKEFTRLQRELITERLRVVDNPAKMAAEYFVHFLYEGMRYAFPIEGSQDSLHNILSSDVLKFYQKHFKPNRASLIVVGSVSREKVLNWAGKYFSGWQGKSDDKLAEPECKQPQRTRLFLIDKPGAAQCELRMGHLGIKRSNPDFYAVTLMNEILGGFFLSRINRNLREEHAYTYGASSGFSYRKGKGTFSITAAIHNDNIAPAIAEVFKEIKRLREEDVSTEELENACGQLVGIFPIAFETAEQVAVGLANILTSALPDDYYHTFREKISRVSLHDIRRVAHKYLHPDQTLIVVTGDRTRIEEPLRQAFEVQVLNAKGNEIDSEREKNTIKEEKPCPARNK